MARLAWGASAPVSEPAFEVKHHTAEASIRRRPGVLVGRCLVRRRQIDPELHHLEVSAPGCGDRSVSQWVCDGAVAQSILMIAITAAATITTIARRTYSK
jgi:hypothetical protein